jgi:EmrB/QacA subfamily drug resistance transporter
MPLDPEAIYRRRWWTLAVLCLSLVMVIVGNTVLNVALPTLVKELHATNTQLQWVVDAYGLVFAGLLLSSGALGDRFGRKYALNVGLVLFGVTSALAAFSGSATQVIAARAVMGLAASLVMPATLSILTSVFPPNERARAIAIWAGLSGAGAAVGPIASGWLLEHFWWGSVFLLNTPVALTALVAGRFLVPNSRDAHPAPLDPVGAGLSILGLATLVYGIIEAPVHGWGSTSSLVAFSGAAIVLAAFAAWELHTPDPMLDLRFFKQRGFSAGAGGITLNFFAMFGMFFLLTQYLQLVLGYDPLQAGVRVVPFALTIMVAAPSSARVAERIGTRGVVAMGQCLLGSGLLLLATCGVHTGYGRLVVALVVMAAGTGLTVAPCTASIMSSLPMRKAGVGSAVNDTTRELGGALGVAVLGSLVASQYTGKLGPALGALPAPLRAAARNSLGEALQVAARIGGPEGARLANTARVAFTHGLHTALVVAAVVAFGGAGLIARFMPAQVSVGATPGPEVAAPETVALEP